ncbi:alkaline phosphatase D family protein [Jatrophihabitans sp. YIM 134969]
MSPSAALSRRTVLKSAALGAVAAAVPLRWFDAEAAAAPAADGVFGYGVASGDPTATSVIIWTRATPSPDAIPGSGLGAPVRVTWEVATDSRFATIVKTGTVQTSAASDHTVKVDVTGLAVYRRYWYRFRALKQQSVVGRTQTAPDDRSTTHALRFALVSCSNYTGGYFGPYRAIANRKDLDFVLHVGDYIYEYGNGSDRYGPPELAGTRDSQPATETIDLQGYRLRHALHKADPDLALCHKRLPFITIFDDHEVANNAWNKGVENHTPGTEGDFATRRAQAYQAYMEWMPFRLPDQSVPHKGTRFFRRFTYGRLADLSVLETRQNRSKQVDVAPYTTTGGGFIPVDDAAANAKLADPSRHLPEPEQLTWLKDGAKGTRPWHLFGNQVILTPLRFPGAIVGVPGNVLNSDQWDGYQADQKSFTGFLAKRPATSGDSVFLTGDIHSSWAMDIPSDMSDAASPSAGVEFVCPSVTSDGFYEIVRDRLGVAPEAAVVVVGGLGASVRTHNPWVKYVDGVGHGFTVVDVTPDRVQADWYLTPTPTSADPDPRVDPATVPAYASSWQTLAGSRRVTVVGAKLGARSDTPSGPSA